MYNIAEGDSVVIQVILDHPPGNDIVIMINVDLSTAAGMHAKCNPCCKYYAKFSASDYRLSHTNVTFGPNDTSQIVTLLAVDDDIVEYDELLTLSIMIPDQLMKIGVLLGDVNMTTVNITDNDSESNIV